MNPLRQIPIITVLAFAASLSVSSTWGDSGQREFTAAQLKAVVSTHFENKQDFENGDLIGQADARDMLASLEKLGWKVSDGEKILQQMLPSDHIIAKTFASTQGRNFMRKVDGYQLIYDRLHRTAELPGGKALVRDIVKLPNGEIYAKMKPVPGNPNFTDLLPKGRNGKTPTPRDFDKPTGYIYTVGELVKRLEQSRQRDFAKSAATR
jgi:hypothetical protein